MPRGQVLRHRARVPRRATPEEAARIASAGLGDLFAASNEHVVGLDGIAVIVNAKNPTNALHVPELARIFSGETKTWTGDGKNLGVIKLFARDDKSGTFDVFRSLVLGASPLGLAKRFADNGALADAVAGDEHAIGFVPMHAAQNAKVLDIGEQGMTPLVPSDFTVSTESYPLTRRIYLYTTGGSTNPLAHELLDFALSADGQKVVASAGFVNLSVKTRLATACDAQCPARYASLTEKAERLSIDFRFQSSSAALDTRAREDVSRVSAFAKSRPDARLALFGFSDDVGAPDVNLQISSSARGRSKLSFERWARSRPWWRASANRCPSPPTAQRAAASATGGWRRGCCPAESGRPPG